MDSGLPLTLTSETASRYFIDKYKACNLILKIATFNKLEGQIFTFNMGDPIKLMDLANCVIDCFPEKKEAVEIKITGLRTGEKHHEEIISKNELLSATTDKDIFRVTRKDEKIVENIDWNKLLNIIPYQSPQEIKKILLNWFKLFPFAKKLPPN